MRVPIEQVVPNMVLAEHVLFPNGSVAIPFGTALTTSLIEKIIHLGISELTIADPQKQSPPANEQQKSQPLHSTKEEPQAQPSTPPLITVFVSQDTMSASLRIEKTPESHSTITADDIYAAFHKAGVINGIQEKMVTTAIALWKKNGTMIDLDDVAHATTGVSETKVEIDVKHLNTVEEITAARKCSYYSELRSLAAKVQPVAKGTTVARIITITKKPAIDVAGNSIESKDSPSYDICFDSSIVLNEKGTEATAAVDGIAYCTGKEIGIIPLSFDAHTELIITPDKMSAELMVYPASQGGISIDKEKIYAELKEKGIIYGINANAIDSIAQTDFSKTNAPQSVVIASGTAPIDGTDSKLEYFFQTASDLVPKQNADGTVDYKNISLIHSVKKDDPLVKLIPAKKGSDGKNISGETIPSKDGVVLALPMGPNTAQSPQDSNILIAMINGVLRNTPKAIEVCEGYVVDGDVDYTTGNIHYDKSIIIKGDVKSGFSIECGGDLEVDGIIEDCEIIVHGNVLCKHGFVGHGKGVIKADGDVNIGFLNNQTILCKGSVHIAKEAINGKIKSGKTIIVDGQHLSIAGGSLIAREEIIAKVVGNEEGVRTELSVGIDFILEDQINEIDKAIHHLTENRIKIQNAAQSFDHLVKLKKHLTPEQMDLQKKVHESLVKHDQEIEKLKTSLVELRKKSTDLEKARIKIAQMMYAGTFVKVCHHQHLIEETLQGSKLITFDKRNDDILVC